MQTNQVLLLSSAAHNYSTDADSSAGISGWRNLAEAGLRQNKVLVFAVVQWEVRVQLKCVMVRMAVKVGMSWQRTTSRSGCKNQHTFYTLSPLVHAERLKTAGSASSVPGFTAGFGRCWPTRNVSPRVDLPPCRTSRHSGTLLQREHPTSSNSYPSPMSAPDTPV